MSDYSELKRLAEHHLSLGHAYTVATPSAVLALIAERDQLKSENELLASSRAKLAGELSRLRAKHEDWSVSAALGQGEQS